MAYEGGTDVVEVGTSLFLKAVAVCGDEIAGTLRELDGGFCKSSSANNFVSVLRACERDTDADEETLRDNEERSISSASERISLRDVSDRDIDSDDL